MIINNTYSSPRVKYFILFLFAAISINSAQNEPASKNILLQPVDSVKTPFNDSIEKALNSKFDTTEKIQLVIIDRLNMFAAARQRKKVIEPVLPAAPCDPDTVTIYKRWRLADLFNRKNKTDRN